MCSTLDSLVKWNLSSSFSSLGQINEEYFTSGCKRLRKRRPPFPGTLPISRILHEIPNVSAPLIRSGARASCGRRRREVFEEIGRATDNVESFFVAALLAVIRRPKELGFRGSKNRIERSSAIQPQFGI
ncbi:hypothetical protein EVAR_65061_1 [Eumeta japonica]|uniref:Uncharacterized protein n=1 Tax=Eumeta variegata TaxID=151549 RepID=A0A4C2A1Q2_EUMVA|nr:hypothetical protein EVAR_65061_1 [Eumeta japonica]